MTAERFAGKPKVNMCDVTAREVLQHCCWNETATTVLQAAADVSKALSRTFDPSPRPPEIVSNEAEEMPAAFPTIFNWAMQASHHRPMRSIVDALLSAIKEMEDDLGLPGSEPLSDRKGFTYGPMLKGETAV